MAEITQKIIINIPYNGAAGWSVNHFKVGGNMAWKLTPEAKATKDEIIIRVKNALAFTDWYPKAPLSVAIAGRFIDRARAIDIHNAIKLVCDALEDALGVDDKYYQVSCGVPLFGIAEPYIIIEVEQK